MNDRSARQGAAMLDQADQAARAGDAARAVSLYHATLALLPEHPRALNGLGNRALSSGDPQAARTFFMRAVRSEPAAAPIWLNLSAAERACGAAQGELDALDGALAADPYFIVALLNKAQWFERHDRPDEAVTAYRSLLQAAPPPDTVPEAMRAALLHGKALVDRQDLALEEAIRAEVGDAARAAPRFDRALEILGGRRRIYLPKPAGLHYPDLPPDEFFDRAHFPWFAMIEDAAPAIRAELLDLVAGGDHGAPYVSIAAGTPENQWNTLNNSLDWSAIFLWNNGVAQDAILSRCPRTAAVLAAIPMLDIPGRGPTAMFSTLRPKAHIPAHHGVTNIRAVVHLPLIVPGKCDFRVGSETRSWKEGVAWAFDDTIEHEAWNDTTGTRVILIVDAWNPYLDETERKLLRAANVVLARRGSRQT